MFIHRQRKSNSIVFNFTVANLNICNKWLLTTSYLPCTQRQKSMWQWTAENFHVFRILKIVHDCRACRQHFLKTQPPSSKNIKHGNTKWCCPQGRKLWMNTLEKGTFNEVFFYTVCNYHEQSIVATIMKYNYMLNWNKINRVLATVKNSAVNVVSPVWSRIELPNLFFPNT